MKRLGFVAALAVASQPVHAQSASHFDNHGRSETRAMVGVTIPLGGQRNKADTRPRLDFRFDTSRIDADSAQARVLNPLLQDRRDMRQTVFSLTFEERPRLMFNGQSLVRFGPALYADEDAEQAEPTEEGEDRERGTGEKILRGAGWVGIGLLGLTVVGVGSLYLACSGDDNDCFRDE